MSQPNKPTAPDRDLATVLMRAQGQSLAASGERVALARHKTGCVLVKGAKKLPHGNGLFCSDIVPA